MRANYRLQRLFVTDSLSADTVLELPPGQAHYLVHVLRMKEGGALLVFNGTDGEWRAEIAHTIKKSVTLRIIAQERPQPVAPDLIYCFAPLKHARLDYMVQKAVEMGAGVLQPVITRHTQITRLNLERIKANTIEAAEQCGILALPQCRSPLTLDMLLAEWDSTRPLIFCDEAAEGDNPLPLLTALKHKGTTPPRPGLIIGPEGGFSNDERAALNAQNFVISIPLGPRILRADTAAVAAFAVINATLGDWS